MNLSQTGMPGESLGFCFWLLLRLMAQFGALFIPEDVPDAHDEMWLYSRSSKD